MTTQAPDGIRPDPGQLLVDVEAAGVNYLDVYQRKGISKVELPYTPGLEGVGRVREVGQGIGSDTDRLEPGRRVAWINVLGSYAEQVVVPAAQAIPLPDSFATVQALLFQAITAVLDYGVPDAAARGSRAGALGGGRRFSYVADPAELSNARLLFSTPSVRDDFG
jgi:NADPH:quinone reductase-like Zn-dependent oxidoreductase